MIATTAPETGRRLRHGSRALLARRVSACLGARITAALLSAPPRLRLQPTERLLLLRRRTARLGAIVYEVSNTFGERKSYVIPVERDDGGAIVARLRQGDVRLPVHQRGGALRRSASCRPGGASSLVGIVFHDAMAPCSKRVSAGASQLSNWTLAGLVARHPLMTFKVVAGIHIQAARLWLKGVPLVERHVSPAYSFTVVKPTTAAAGPTPCLTTKWPTRRRQSPPDRLSAILSDAAGAIRFLGAALLGRPTAGRVHLTLPSGVTPSSGPVDRDIAAQLAQTIACCRRPLGAGRLVSPTAIWQAT